MKWKPRATRHPYWASAACDHDVSRSPPRSPPAACPPPLSPGATAPASGLASPTPAAPRPRRPAAHRRNTNSCVIKTSLRCDLRIPIQAARATPHTPPPRSPPPPSRGAAALCRRPPCPGRQASCLRRVPPSRGCRALSGGHPPLTSAARRRPPCIPRSGNNLPCHPTHC